MKDVRFQLYASASRTTTGIFQSSEVRQLLQVLQRLQQWARSIKRDVVALYLAARDPRVPWYAKVVAACVAAYALSPIDLVPDFIPILGYLDDVILVPLGIMFAVRLIPSHLLEEHRKAAIERNAARPVSWAGAAVMIIMWLALVALLLLWLSRRYFPGS